jgi:phosphoglycolate phosphatase
VVVISITPVLRRSLPVKFKAVLFDLDGTLLDTLQDLSDSMNAALHQLGFPGHDAETCKYFIGDGMEKFAFRALPENYRDETTVVNCTAAMRDEYSRRWARKTRPYPGIPDLLDGLNTRNLKMAILSNKPDDSTKTMVAALLARWKFNPVEGARSDLPKKPDPTLALQICQELDVPAPEILYLGDTATDMKTARAAGMFPVGALWGFRTAEELEAAGAEVLVDHPTEVLQLLE